VYRLGETREAPDELGEAEAENRASPCQPGGSGAQTVGLAGRTSTVGAEINTRPFLTRRVGCWRVPCRHGAGSFEPAAQSPCRPGRLPWPASRAMTRTGILKWGFASRY